MEKFNPGDIVRCKTGYNTCEAHVHDLGAGSGYAPGKVFTVIRIQETKHFSVKTGLMETFTILWPEHGNGVYSHAVVDINVTVIENIINNINKELNDEIS